MQQSTTGHNFGKYKLCDDMLLLNPVRTKDKDKVIMEIPFKQINLINASGKNEVAVELNVEPADRGDQVCEVRFSVHNSEIVEGNRNENKQSSEEDKEADEEQEEITPANCFKNRLVRAAGLKDQKGDIIATFLELPMMIPRGKYTMDMYHDFAKFHGRTYDYKIMYKDVKKVFQLPRVDLGQIAIVIQLIKPLKQGQTLHHFIIIQVDKDQESKVKINLTKEQIQERYEGNIEQEVEGPLYHVLATMFKNIVDVERIIIPGDFKSASDDKDPKDDSKMVVQCVKCAVKANDGYLYPLKSSLIFIHKPVIYIKHSSIKYIEFTRVNSNSRSFDLHIIPVNAAAGEGEAPCQSFLNIEQNELKVMMRYFKGTNIRIRELEGDRGDRKKEIGESSSDEDGPGYKAKKRGIIGGQREWKANREVHAEHSHDEDEDDDEDADFTEKDIKAMQGGQGSDEEGESDMSDDVDAGVDQEELKHLKGNKQFEKNERKKRRK